VRFRFLGSLRCQKRNGEEKGWTFGAQKNLRPSRGGGFLKPPQKRSQSGSYLTSSLGDYSKQMEAALRKTVGDFAALWRANELEGEGGLETKKVRGVSG